MLTNSNESSFDKYVGECNSILGETERLLNLSSPKKVVKNKMISIKNCASINRLRSVNSELKSRAWRLKLTHDFNQLKQEVKSLK